MAFIHRMLMAGFAAGSLSACATVPPGAESPVVATVSTNPFDPFALEIEAGRWNAMNAQMTQIVDGMMPAVAAPDHETDADRRAALSQLLRIEVLQLIWLKASACPDGKLPKSACASDFSPEWAWRKEAEPVSWAELQKRSDAVGDVVMPVWDEVCAKAKERAGPQQEEEMICPME